MAKGWYVVHTYSGYEMKIEKTIRKIMETDLTFAEVVLDVKVPTEEVVEVKDGVKKTIKRKILPSYILVQMDLPQHMWEGYCSQIRRIQGVTGFVGIQPGKKPVPLSPMNSRVFFRRPVRFRVRKCCGRNRLSVSASTLRLSRVPSKHSPVSLEEVNLRKRNCASLSEYSDGVRRLMLIFYKSKRSDARLYVFSSFCIIILPAFQNDSDRHVP